MIKYYKLFDLLNRRGMKKSDLLCIISSKTIAKLSKGENLTTDIIDKICTFLKCQPNDIMEVITDAHEIADNTIMYTVNTIDKKWLPELEVINEITQIKDENSNIIFDINEVSVNENKLTK